MRPDAPEVVWRYAERAASPAQEERLFLDAEQRGASGVLFVDYAGRLLYDMGLYERAVPYLEVLARNVYANMPRHPAAADTLRRLMVSVAWMEDYEAAYNVASQLIERDPDPQGFAEAAYVALMWGDYPDAETWAETALEDEPENSTALWVMAHVMWWRDDNLDKALDYIALAEQAGYTVPFLTPEFGHYRYGDRAYMLWEADETERALAWFSKGIDERVNGYDILYLDRADLHYELGNLEDARADYEQALRVIDDSALEREINDQISDIDAQMAGET
jgi:tetratricopeptide (TPR) repeat protein